MTKPTYRAGDKITIVLDEYDAVSLNDKHGSRISLQQIIHHEPAPKPEPIVVWQARDSVNAWWCSRTTGFYAENWKQIRKITIDPETMKAEIEVVK